MFRKSILATLCFCISAAASAAPASIPKQFRGDWCFLEGTDYILRRCKTESGTNFRITAHAYGAIKSNWTCTFSSIGFDNDADENGLRAVTTDSLCIRDYTMKMKSIFQLNDDGSLIFLSVPLSHSYPQ